MTKVCTHGRDKKLATRMLEESLRRLQIAVDFKPPAAAEMQSLRDQCRVVVADGRYELFKMTTKYDGKVGREQHHFPTTQELPL